MANYIIKGLRKFSPVWQEAKDKDINEADVVTRIIKFLEDALGYDVLNHITKEFQIKERFVDLAIKVDSEIKFYIEVKSANTNLKESHIFQAESYASQSGVNWVVLTNGGEWQFYHLTFDKTGIEHTLITTLDLINGDVNQNADKLYYLSYEAVKKNELEAYWDKCLSLQPVSIIKALFHEDTLSTIRREIRKKSKSGVLIDEDSLVDGIRKLLSPTVVAEHGENIKISRKRRGMKKGDDDNSSGDQLPIQETDSATATISDKSSPEEKPIDPTQTPP
ncbi:MAG: hypothetical protein A2X34_04790 [Elusimicrobia bacterium GWC2_51_8]|nr:MAG: hypothetical protein A2X33_05545 [Elusimicrobia bacterium GWA2_51_34]OGR60405.1 MAG: hypothetical protein A2X34_04790 [Elusimicrobia bacterium GWC2_51_8]OGR86186.1 MAG: hypothetical protein A2021_06100 [Elusimicrobia bacterium GWF2_52_66]HAF94832.1 hypothetical protein [Elusimicrobiota bacterium]HCE96960.1 hypothetical protein [Elusimicrobiota bacterium]